MADIMGVPLPKSKVGTAVVITVVAGVPLAATAAALFFGGRALLRRMRPETLEEYAARMERVAHLDGIYENSR